MTGYSKNYEQLANAVIVLAAKDYRQAYKKLRKNPQDPTAALTLKQLARFFTSCRYGHMTSVDGEYLLGCLNKEVEAELGGGKR